MAEKRREGKAARKAAKKAKAVEPEIVADPIQLPAKPENEEELTQVMREIIQTTHHANGWRHLGELGHQLRERYTDLQWSDYGCKKLIDFLQKYPETFRIKWSAPAHKGASHTWVRLSDYKKEKKPQ